MAVSKISVKGQRMSAIDVAETIEKNTVFAYRPSKTASIDPLTRIEFLGEGRLSGQTTSLPVRYLGKSFTCICHSTEANDGDKITVRRGEVLSITRLSNCLKWAAGGSGRVTGEWEGWWVDSFGLSFAEYRAYIE